MGKFRNLTGMTFGRLTVEGIYEKDRFNKYLYKCKCTCGNEYITHGRTLLNGSCKSCGCLNRDVKIQKSKYKGLAQQEKRLYHIWKGMMARCFNKTCECYEDYGGRGISVCNEWATPISGFSTFVNWAKANGYSDTLTIDRINNDDGYYPNNCRWADWITQANNRRIPHMVTNQYGTWNYKKPLPEPPKEDNNEGS